MFALLQQEEVPSPCVPRNLLCLVFESSSSFLENSNRPFSVFKLTLEPQAHSRHTLSVPLSP